MELIERLVLSLTNEGDWVLDPFLGTGTSIIAAIRHRRRGVGVELARQRIQQEIEGTLRTRPMDKPIYNPPEGDTIFATNLQTKNTKQITLFTKSPKYGKDTRE